MEENNLKEQIKKMSDKELKEYYTMECVSLHSATIYTSIMNSCEQFEKATIGANLINHHSAIINLVIKEIDSRRKDNAQELA